MLIIENGTFDVQANYGMGFEAVENGTWTKSGATYTFVFDYSSGFQPDTPSTLNISNDVLVYMDGMSGDSMTFMPIVTPDPADPVIGTYENTTKDYTMNVNDDGSFELIMAGRRGETIVGGVWLNDNGTYTFTSSDSDVEVTYAGGTFTVTIQPADPGTEENPNPPTVVTLTKATETEDSSEPSAN